MVMDACPMPITRHVLSQADGERGNGPDRAGLQVCCLASLGVAGYGHGTSCGEIHILSLLFSRYGA